MKIEFYHVDAFEVPNYEPIWRKLIEKGVDARMVGVPGDKNTASSGWFDFERFQSYCNEHAIPFTTEIDRTSNLALTTQNASILREYICPRVRLMYGPILYPTAWGLQEISVKPFDAVLTHGKAYEQFFSTWLRPDQLPIAGYPRYDDFFAGRLDRRAIRAAWGVDDKKPVLVFLPTWGDNTAFDKFFPALLNLSHKYQIILRPHHCTVRLEPHRMTLLKASGFLMLENAFDLAKVYAGADVILSDMRSGGMFEACMCDRPAVGMVIDEAEKTSWLNHHNISKMISLCSDPAELEASIEKALTSTSQAAFRQNWATHFVAYRDGNAAERAAEALIRLASQHTQMPVSLLGATSISHSSHLLSPDFKTNLDKN